MRPSLLTLTTLLFVVAGFHPLTVAAVQVKVGTVQFIAPNSHFHETFSSLELTQGLAAAFFDSNANGDLGSGNTINLLMKNCSSVATGCQAEVDELYVTDQVLTIALTTPLSVPSAFAAASSSAVNAPLVAPQLDSGVALSRNAINVKMGVEEEVGLMLNVALNSKLHCQRFGIISNSNSSSAAAAALQSQLSLHR